MAKSDSIKKRETPPEVKTEEYVKGEEEREELFVVRFDTPLKKRMIEALITSLGVVTPACNATGISRQTHYRWLREDELYRATVEEMGEIALDFAENKLHKAMQENDITAIIFYLKTKGKKRGYLERLEFVPPERSSIDMTKLTREEREKLYLMIDKMEEGS